MAAAASACASVVSLATSAAPEAAIPADAASLDANSSDDLARFTCAMAEAEPIMLPMPETARCRHWTLGGLRATVGDNECFVRRNTAEESYRKGRFKIERTTFGAYVDALLANTKKAQSSYLAVQNIRNSFPELADDVDFKPYVQKIHAGPFLWVAKAGHYEYCHMDPDDGMLMVISGEKRVRMFAPDPMQSLYPNKLGSGGRTVQSQVDLDNVDKKKFPEFGKARQWEFVVRAGEMLFIPAFFWHQVSSPELTLSVNVFFGDAGQNKYLSKIMRNPQWQGFSHWLLNVVEQNRQKPSFVRILPRIDESVNVFLYNQWHEQPTQQQMERILKLVLDYCGLDGVPAPPPLAEGEEPPYRSKHPPKLKIRGLLWRTDND